MSFFTPTHSLDVGSVFSYLDNNSAETRKNINFVAIRITSNIYYLLYCKYWWTAVNQEFYIHFLKKIGPQHKLVVMVSGTEAVFGFVRCCMIRRVPREPRRDGAGEVLHLDLGGVYLGTHIWKIHWVGFGICAFQSLCYISTQTNKEKKNSGSWHLLPHSQPAIRVRKEEGCTFRTQWPLCAPSWPSELSCALRLIANATSSVKSSWNSLLGLRSPFFCLPDFGYSCFTLWLQLLGSPSLGPKNVHFWREGRYIICWSQCKIKMRGLLSLEKSVSPFLLQCLPLCLSWCFLFAIWCCTPSCTGILTGPSQTLKDWAGWARLTLSLPSSCQGSVVSGVMYRLLAHAALPPGKLLGCHMQPPACRPRGWSWGSGRSLPRSAKLDHALPKAGSILLEDHGLLHIQVESMIRSQDWGIWEGEVKGTVREAPSPLDPWLLGVLIPTLHSLGSPSARGKGILSFFVSWLPSVWLPSLTLRQK